MAKTAVLVPQQEMCGMVNAMIGAYESITPMCVEYIQSGQLTARVQALETEGCELIVARGLYANMAKRSVKLPVVEIRVTAQELGMLVVELKEALGIPRPKIALVCFANMMCDTSLFDRLFGVDVATYPVEPSFNMSENVYDSGMRALRSAVSIAVQDGCHAIIGGEVACAHARTLGVPCRFISSGWDSLRSALDIAERVSYAIDLEKSNAAQINTMLNYTFNGILQVDEAGNALRANRAMLSLLYSMPKDVLGKNVTELFPALTQEIMNSVLAEGKEVYAALVPIRKRQTVADIVPIRMENRVTGAILTFHEQERIMEMDSELRKEMYTQGYMARFRFDRLPVENAESRKRVRLAERMARYSAPILMTGEAGSGKRILAECIHNAGTTRDSAFIPLDCGAYHPDTLDTMLFGNYTTRKDTANCLVEIARGGTLYLSHVEALSPELQNKLMSLIQGSFVRNGSNHPAAIDVHVIASTDVNLITCVERKEFRSDLYYALNVLSLNCPPLRRCREDIPGWVDFYLKHWQDRHKRFVSLTDGARAYLQGYDWPGNIHQVDSVCERIVLLSERRSVDEGFLRRQMDEIAPTVISGEQVVVFKDQKAMQLAALLKKYDGNRQQVADELGISKTTLWRHMKKYGIEKDFSY